MKTTRQKDGNFDNPQCRDSCRYPVLNSTREFRVHDTGTLEFRASRSFWLEDLGFLGLGFKSLGLRAVCVKIVAPKRPKMSFTLYWSHSSREVCP